MRDPYQTFPNPHSEIVSKGTLRRLYQRFNRPVYGLKHNEDGTMTTVVLDAKTLDIFKGFRTRISPAVSFKVWVKLNIRQILRHYDSVPGFTLPAGKLLEI